MRSYLEGTATQQQRAYSPAVVTQGGRTVWLAGHTAGRDVEPPAPSASLWTVCPMYSRVYGRETWPTEGA
jgi:hypothetical protein